MIIIRLFRDLCTAEHEGLVKEFLPMIQGLLETFLQSRDSVPYIEVTKSIYKDLISVQKDSKTKNIKVVSYVFKVEVFVS